MRFQKWIDPGVNPQGETRKHCGHEVPCGETGEEKLRRDLRRGAVGVTKNNVVVMCGDVGLGCQERDV